METVADKADYNDRVHQDWDVDDNGITVERNDDTVVQHSLGDNNGNQNVFLIDNNGKNNSGQLDESNGNKEGNLVVDNKEDAVIFLLYY